MDFRRLPCRARGIRAAVFPLVMRRRLLLLIALIFVAAAPHPRTEVAVRVNTPALTIEHRESMAQEVSRALNQPNIRVTVIMSDRIIGAVAHPERSEGSTEPSRWPTPRAARVAKTSR